MSILPNFFAEAANPVETAPNTPRLSVPVAQETAGPAAESANENLFVINDKNTPALQRGAMSGHHDGIAFSGLFSQFSEAAKDEKKEKEEKRKENDRLYIFLQTQAQRLADIARDIENNNKKIQEIRNELEKLAKLKEAIQKQYERDGYVRLDEKQIAELHSYGVDVEAVLQGDIENGFKPAWQQREEEKHGLEERNKKSEQDRDAIFENIKSEHAEISYEEKIGEINKILSEDNPKDVVLALSKINGEDTTALEEKNQMQTNISADIKLGKFSLN